MILLIDNNKGRRDTLCEIFHYMGILSFGTDSEGAFSHFNADYRAILISEPAELTDACDYIRRLKAHTGRTPVFTTSRDRLPYALRGEVAIAFDDDVSSSDMISEMIEYLDGLGLPSPGKYLLAGLDAGCDLNEVRYMSQHMDFTKTETMILRYLILTYPRQIKAEELLKHTFKPGRTPEPSCIRTHISAINKKFSRLRGRILVTSDGGEGYTILTPELIAQK